MQVKEFKIEALPELELRVMRISPVDLLALTTQMDFDKFAQTKEFYKFALEHVEVKQGEKWFQVKYPDREVYTPTTIEDNLSALNQIIQWFFENVIVPAFPQSSE